MTDSNHSRALALVTGASTGIGYELALVCARNGFDLLVAADEPRIRDAAEDFRNAGAQMVEAIEADLATTEGVKRLHDAVGKLGRPVDALFANAGRGLGRGFLDQEPDAWRKVIDTNITGTLDLVQRIGREMRSRGEGRILITGSIAGYIPGSFQAVYNGTKAFLDSFSFALRDELKDTGVVVTVLEPGATDTEFFKRADMMDTAVGTGKKDDPAMVAQKGFDTLMAGDGDVVTGLKNKLQTTLANITPAGVLAAQHRKMAEPGSAKT
jgi:uncharacterized protein